LVNKTDQVLDSVHFKIKDQKGIIKLVADQYVTVKANSIGEGTLFIEVPETDLTGEKDRLEIQIYQGERLVESTQAAFLGPRTFN
jgi:hypothetical protein